MDSGEYLTLTEAAKHLRISRWTLYRRIEEGALQAFTSPVNKRVKLVCKHDVDTLLTPKRTTPIAAQKMEHDEGR